MVGNFIGDFVKGNQLENFEYAIKQGIVLHRVIDEYTDRHPMVLQSKSRLRTKYRHYSGVIVDIFYDHFLARNWSRYHHVPLPVFTKKTYRQLMNYEDILPAKVLHMLPFMIEKDWLLHYREMEGMARALKGMALRTPFDSKMDEATADLEWQYSGFQKEFELFFEDIRTFTGDWIGREIA